VLVREDEQELPDGRRQVNPVLQLRGSAGILPFFSFAEVLAMARTTALPAA